MSASWERLLAEALRSDDPPAALRRAARRRTVPPALRRALLTVDEDGLRMAALLVARLRFERLLRASAEAERWFNDDPQRFAEGFRRYHAEVAPRAFFPSGEAAQFAAWRATSRGGRSDRRGPS